MPWSCHGDTPRSARSDFGFVLDVLHAGVGYVGFCEGAVLGGSSAILFDEICGGVFLLYLYATHAQMCGLALSPSGATDARSSAANHFSGGGC